MRPLATRAWIVFVLFAVLVILFGVFPGPWFEAGDITRDAQWLITTFAAVAAVLTLAVALTAFRRGERWAWIAFWIWPVFFVIHGFLFFVVDFVFAAIGVVALLISQPRSVPTPGPDRL
jgi:membrane protease YdiL (CAAX protease family)